ncbi:MAG: thermopsin [Thermoplasmata archaeon]|nr:thermopsin [Thermoplasmata archaeon]
MVGPKPRALGVLMVALVGLVVLLVLPTTVIASSRSAAPSLPATPSMETPSDLAPSHPGLLLRSDVANPSGSPRASISPVASAPGDSLPPHPRASIVNPLQFYTREPAPMGIADFGVTGTSPGATAYEYSSPSFQGQAVVRSLSVSIGGSSSKVTAFELNAVVELQRNGTNYSYWIQNGLHLDAGSDEFTIGGAYVWNFSSPGARLSSGELSGNAGSALATDTYYDIPSCGPTYPGQCTTIGLPATLTGRILTSTSGGYPYVAYQYDLGSGWVTYDNVTFNHMANASDSGFRVDGFAPTPYAAGLYYDSEWVWVGAGGGSASTDQQSDINLTLSWWNGHNFQAVPTAWNFGSNTGETSTNVTDVGTVPLGGHLTSGPGTLGVLYNRTGVGFLNLTVPTLGSATVLVDGRSLPFHGGWANLTLPVGTHSLDLQNFTNASDSFAILAGSTTPVNLSGAGEVIFNESGLPMGTPWGVTINGTRLGTSFQNLSAHLPNGTYPLAYAEVSGFYLLGTNPVTLTLPGPSRISLTFAPVTYAVNFTESGLPASTPWWVNASGSLVQSTDTFLQLMAPNGSTNYTVGSLYEFLANPHGGSIVVSAGVATPVAVAFSYRPTFISGTVVPADAEVSIAGIVQALSGGGFNDSVIPGSYDLVASATGYATDHLTVTATPGNVTVEDLTLRANQTQPSQTSPGPTAGGGIPVDTAVLLVGAVAAVAIAAVVVVMRRRT